MKRCVTCLVLASSLTAFAGEPMYSEPAPAAPAASLWSWFVGGTGGYLTDAEEGFFSGHLGAERFVGEASHALYLEVGWTGDDDNFKETILVNQSTGQSPPGKGFEFRTRNVNVDIDIIPVTLNYKYERPLFSTFNFYLGAGAGVAFVDVDVQYHGDDDDQVFFGQVFGGIVANISQQFEVFAGARWVYIDEVDIGDADVDSQDDVLIEGGLRFNF
jgi:opacity protein-like surface antigen